jgi:hypothetical protein
MKILKITFSTLLLLFITTPIWAQSFGGPPSFLPDVQDNPIDGGLSVLLGAGAVYGAKKLRDFRNSKNPKNTDHQD